MPKLPRDISGRGLAKKLEKFGYKPVRQTGSHIRLVSEYKGKKHSITIPDHAYLKVGTLNNILNEVSSYLEVSKDTLISDLFG